MSEFQLARTSESATNLASVVATLEETAPLLAEEESQALTTFCKLIGAFRSLCLWAAARRAAEADAGRHLDAAKEQVALVTEQVPTLKYPIFVEAAKTVAKLFAAVTETGSLPKIAAVLAQVPIPPFLVASEAPFGTSRRSAPETTFSPPVEGPFVVRLMLTLDGRAWSNPQILRAGVIYDLKAKVTAPVWPSVADTLVLDFISTLPSEHRRTKPIEILRSQAESGLEVTWSGHIEFPVGQSLLAEPVLLQMRATFISTTDADAEDTATIVGYHKLRVRISDSKAIPLLSKYRVLDQRVISIVDEVRALPDLDEQHLADFIELLGVILNYMGICAQQAIYRAGNKILEKDFQRDLLIHLRGHLGEEVQEAPRLGGGITDIRYRSVTAELKVEPDVSDREKMLESYQNQPTQYSSASGAQLGILCVLDLTEKNLPPAPPQNNVRLLTPTLHGFAETEAPSPVRIAAIVIDGNLRRPSDYS